MLSRSVIRSVKTLFFHSLIESRAVTLALLFDGSGSMVVEVAEAMFVIASVSTGLILTTIVNEAEEPAVRVVIEQVKLPVVPTGGVIQVNAGPVSCDAETNVVFAGVGSDNMTLCASEGPLFTSVM